MRIESTSALMEQSWVRPLDENTWVNVVDDLWRQYADRMLQDNSSGCSSGLEDPDVNKKGQIIEKLKLKSSRFTCMLSGNRDILKMENQRSAYHWQLRSGDPKIILN